MKKSRVFQKVANIAAFILLFALAVVGGFLFGGKVGAIAVSITGAPLRALFLIPFALALYIVFLLSVIIHECGHLLFGLVTGYRFRSFRIFGFMLIKREGKLCFSRHSLMGTGGQCLLTPPKAREGKKTPTFLYNLGGAFLNLLFAGIFLGIYFLFKANVFLSAVFLFGALIQLLFALANGIPMRLSQMDNDGMNAWTLSRNEEARRAFLLQMKLHDTLADGTRLADMPDEWFPDLSPEERQDPLSAAVSVFRANRLLDKGDLAAAEICIQTLLSEENALSGIHRLLLTNDYIYLLSLRPEARDSAKALMTKAQVSLMRSMKKHPAVLRTAYAYLLLVKKDSAEAARVRLLYDTAVLRYPYPADIAGENDLVTRAKEVAEKEA